MVNNLKDVIDGDVEDALLRLWSDELSEAEAAAIRTRVRNDPKYREDFHGLLAILASMEALAGDRAIQVIVPDIRQLIQKRRSRVSAGLGMAAGMLVTIGAALTFLAPWGEPDYSHLETHHTRIGEQRTIQLDDGSVVTLNTAGRLAVDYNDWTRRVGLERGEVYFEVAEDAERPFTVDLGARSVTAVGTAFNIRKTPDRYQLAVIEGTVTFHHAADQLASSQPPVSVDGRPVVISSPGQRSVEKGWVAEYQLSRDRLTAFRPESMEPYHQWRSGTLSFRAERLYRVVQELNRYSAKKILIEDASVMDLSVYATAGIDEIDVVLDGLEKLLPIKVTRHHDRTVITGTEGN